MARLLEMRRALSLMNRTRIAGDEELRAYINQGTKHRNSLANAAGSASVFVSYRGPISLSASALASFVDAIGSLSYQLSPAPW